MFDYLSDRSKEEQEEMALPFLLWIAGKYLNKENEKLFLKGLKDDPEDAFLKMFLILESMDKDRVRLLKEDFVIFRDKVGKTVANKYVEKSISKITKNALQQESPISKNVRGNLHNI